MRGCPEETLREKHRDVALSHVSRERVSKLSSSSSVSQSSTFHEFINEAYHFSKSYCNNRFAGCCPTNFGSPELGLLVPSSIHVAMRGGKQQTSQTLHHTYINPSKSSRVLSLKVSALAALGRE